ncbi:MAG TPA: DNA polymerase I [Candidatus Lustribacter sp.]|jgi:DNA polymerase-1|nr:DNA polymerase I [Candidatus Lustribacter sp.]
MNGRHTPPPQSARLMLLDTYGLVYRAFFALPALTTTQGVPINAAYGFTMMLAKLIADEKPTHVIAAFDKGLPAARVAMYPQYKAQRDEMPGDLRGQFAIVRKILAAYGIPVLEIDGEEADDVMATLARIAREDGQTTIVVTGDLDMLQTVDDATTVLTTRRGITDLGRYDAAAVRERFDLEPHQLPDYRGLKGDPSDNLPGIPGVGEKTAIKLVRAAGSLDALLADPKLAGTPKLEALVREHGATARVCRDVSIIKRDLAVTLDWSAAQFTQPSNDALYTLYRELEFKGLLAKLTPPDNPVPVSTEELLQGTYVSYVETPGAATDPPDFVRLAELLQAAAGAPRVALALRGEAIGVSPADESGFAFDRGALTNAPVGAAFAALWAAVPELVVYDAKTVIGTLQLPPRAIADDPMIGAHLLDPARTYADVSQAASAVLHRVLPEDAAAAADAASRITRVARTELEAREQLALYADIEVPLAVVLAKIERAGVALDPAALVDLRARCDSDVERLQGEIYAAAGETFNIGSPQQLGRVLFDKLNLPHGGKNKTGYATGVEVLAGLARSFPIAAKVLEYREVTKLKNTYIDVLPALIDPRDRRLHTVLNQTATATGRLSSVNPNLQNVPVRSELGRQIRRAFVAGSPSRVLLAADYSQIELRLMAHLSGDAAMREAFWEHQDIHDFTARRIFEIGPFADVTPNQRRMAKSVNFGLLYGMSDFGLAQRLEIERGEARAITEAYFARFPGVRGYIDRCLEDGRERGYVSTLLGRRRYMPDLAAKNYALRAAAEREATNAPLQGSAADLMKLAMVRIDRRLASYGDDVTMILQIHDELIFDVERAVLPAVAAAIKHEMEHALELSVPLEATLKSGTNWYEVESFDPEEEAVES